MGHCLDCLYRQYVCVRDLAAFPKQVLRIDQCTRTCTSSIYTTTYTQMNAELTTTSFISTLGLSSFVLGIALGPLLTGPLSEAYGRRPIYLISWSLFIVWMIPSVVTIHMALIIVSRFVQGLAGGTFLAVAGGTVRDLFSPNEIQKPMVIAAFPVRLSSGPRWGHWSEALSTTICTGGGHTTLSSVGHYFCSSR